MDSATIDAIGSILIIAFCLDVAIIFCTTNDMLQNVCSALMFIIILLAFALSIIFFSATLTFVGGGLVLLYVIVSQFM